MRTEPLRFQRPSDLVGMEGDSPTWVVWHVSQPRWMNLSLPEEVASFLDVKKEDLAELVGPARGLAAIDWAPGMVRIVNARTDAELVSRETQRNRVLAMFPLNKKLMFRLPQAVARHLDVCSDKRPFKGFGSLQTNDVVAWILPEDEYFQFSTFDHALALQRLPREKDYPHIFLVKAHFPYLRPTLEVLNKEREGKSRSG